MNAVEVRQRDDEQILKMTLRSVRSADEAQRESQRRVQQLNRFARCSRESLDRCHGLRLDAALQLLDFSTSRLTTADEAFSWKNTGLYPLSNASTNERIAVFNAFPMVRKMAAQNGHVGCSWVVRSMISAWLGSFISCCSGSVSHARWTVGDCATKSTVRESDSTIEVLEGMVPQQVLGADIVEIVRNIQLAVLLPEVTAKHLDAAFCQRRGKHPPAAASRVVRNGDG